MRLPPATPAPATSDEHPSPGATELGNPAPLVGALILTFLALEMFVFHGVLSEQADQPLEAVLSGVG